MTTAIGLEVAFATPSAGRTPCPIRGIRKHQQKVFASVEVVKIGVVALLLVVALLSGCGGTKQSATTTAAAHPFPEDPQVWARATEPAQRRSLAVLAVDVKRLRAAVARTPKRTLMGTPAVRSGTDRFLRDLDRSPIDLVSKNRIIDHAAAAASASCDQCFQQLEATRPIPQIAGH